MTTTTVRADDVVRIGDITIEHLLDAAPAREWLWQVRMNAQDAQYPAWHCGWGWTREQAIADAYAAGGKRLVSAPA